MKLLSGEKGGMTTMACRHGMQVHNFMKSLISEQLATRLAMRRPTCIGG